MAEIMTESGTINRERKIYTFTASGFTRGRIHAGISPCSTPSMRMRARSASLLTGCKGMATE